MKDTPKDSTPQANPRPSEPEYRLVPVQPWEPSSQGSQGYNGYNADDEIDLVELLKTLWEERTTILTFTLAGALIGILIGFLSPKMYTVTATLLPEYNSESQTGASSLLRQFGGLAGISGLPMSETSSISPDLYPEIVQTLPFQLQIIYQEFYIPEVDSTATLLDYFVEIKKDDRLTKLKAWTVGFPGKIIGLFRNDLEISLQNKIPLDLNKSNILRLTKDERSLVEFLTNNVSATIDKKSGVIIISVNMPDPVVSATVGTFVIDLLTEYIIEHKTNKLKSDINFTESRLYDAQARYEAAGLALSEFLETQSGTAAARIRKGEQLLQSEYEIAFGIYNTLSQQLEHQKLKLQEVTPVFKYLQPIKIPSNASWPNKSLLVISCTLIAGFLSLIFVFVINSNIINKITK